MAEDQYYNPEDTDLLEKYYAIVNSIQESPINPRSPTDVQYEYTNSPQREIPSRKMDEGFDKLGRIFKESLTEVKETIINTNQVIHRDAERTNNYMLNQASVAAGKASTFMSETFSKEFNKPALWSRDIVALTGNVDYRDMTTEQAKYYAGEHMKQRGEMGLVQAGGLAAWLGGGAVPGLAYSFLAQPILEKYVTQRHGYQNYLDKTGMKNILAGQSRNTLMHTGWDDDQKKELTTFLMGRPYSETGFDREEADQIREFADQLGYYKGTASVENYKQKTKSLFTNVREIMKVLHTSVEEAVEVMAGVSMMAGPAGGKPYTEMVGQLVSAVRYTGLPPTQLLGVANQVGESLYNAYGVKKEWGSNWGLELQKNKDTAPIKQAGLEYLMTNPAYMAAFSTWDKDAGEFNVDTAKLLKMGTMGMGDILEEGMKNLSGEDAEAKILSLRNNLPKLVAETGPLPMSQVTMMLPINWVEEMIGPSEEYINAGDAKKRNMFELGVKQYLTKQGVSPGEIGGQTETIMQFKDDPTKFINFAQELDARKLIPKTRTLGGEISGMWQDFITSTTTPEQFEKDQIYFNVKTGKMIEDASGEMVPETERVAAHYLMKTAIDDIRGKLRLPVTAKEKGDAEWVREHGEIIARLQGKREFTGIWGDIRGDIDQVGKIAHRVSLGHLDIELLSDKHSVLPAWEDTYSYAKKEGITMDTAVRRQMEQYGEFSEVVADELLLKQKLDPIEYAKVVTKKLSDFESDARIQAIIKEKGGISSEDLKKLTSERRVALDIGTKIKHAYETGETPYAPGQALKEFARETGQDYVDIAPDVEEYFANVISGFDKKLESPLFAGEEEVGKDKKKLPPEIVSMETLQEITMMLDGIADSLKDTGEGLNSTKAALKIIYEDYKRAK